MTIGVCTKCKQLKEVQHHHSKGYFPPFEDYTELYCKSCDTKAHIKAIKDGRCKINPEERRRLSSNSYCRRYHTSVHKTINVGDDTMMPNVRLYEMILYNKNTGTLCCHTQFKADHNKKLWIVDV